MKGIFENAYFGKPYKTRDEKRALYQCGDDEYHHLFLSSCDIIVDRQGYLNCKENPSMLDIVSEWEEPINEEELDRFSDENNPYEYIDYPTEEEYGKRIGYIEGFKAGYRKAMEDKQ